MRELPYLLIAGTRSFSDYPLLCNRLDPLVDDGPWVVLSGGADGADALGERWAALHGYSVRVFPADWSLGPKAGPLRNGEMVSYLIKKRAVTYVMAVVFWDEKSRGTGDVVSRLRKARIDVAVVNYRKVRAIRENRDEPESFEELNPETPWASLLRAPLVKTEEERAKCRPHNFRKSIKGCPRKKTKGAE